MSAAAPEPGGAAAAFPWDAALRTALRLGVSPDGFWRLSPMELAALIAAHATHGSAPGRSALDDLMRRFPDQPRSDGD